jgi:hypothetical protein
MMIRVARKSAAGRGIEVRRSSLRRLLRQGIDRGRAAGDAAIETAVSALYGALWYRLLLGEPLDHRYAQQLATLTVNGLRAR